MPATNVPGWIPTVESEHRMNCSAIQKSYLSGMRIVTYHAPRREWMAPVIDVPYEIIEDPAYNPRDDETVSGYGPNSRLNYQQKKGQFIDVYK
jgi:hypothetical protein